MRYVRQLEDLSDEELSDLYLNDEISMMDKLAILDEKNRRNPLPPKPDNSQAECVGCGS